MNSQICLFWWMKITATFLQLGANYAILLNQRNFSAFKFSIVSYRFAIKAIKHKISKVFAVTCVKRVCTDRTVKLYNLAQKGSIRFTKLLLPCTSVHAYSPRQSPIVFLQLLYKFSWLALNIKKWKLPIFLACLLLTTSDRNADLD